MEGQKLLIEPSVSVAKKWSLRYPWDTLTGFFLLRDWGQKRSSLYDNLWKTAIRNNWHMRENVSHRWSLVIGALLNRNSYLPLLYLTLRITRLFLWVDHRIRGRIKIGDWIFFLVSILVLFLVILLLEAVDDCMPIWDSSNLTPPLDDELLAHKCLRVSYSIYFLAPALTKAIHSTTYWG